MLLVTIVIILSIIIVVKLIIVWCFFKVPHKASKFGGRLVGKVAIVTGANSGIGLETAKDLAERGARVILACRNIERAVCAKEKIIDYSRNADIHVLHLDLESFASIRKFADNIYESQNRLDILINNAGNYWTENKRTDDGLLIGMQVNYFGPFLLTSLLLPLLKKSAPSRIINVSSFLYSLGSIDLEDLNMEKRFDEHQVYWNAKLCTMLTTIELDRKLKGTGVTVNCLHPGAVNTAIIGKVNNVLIRTILKLLRPFFKSPREGAQTSIYLAVSPEVEKVSGKYFKDCCLAEVRPKAQDLDVARKLWDLSEEIVKIK